MFVYIGRQYVNMNAVTTIDEGTGGQLRLRLSDGNTVYARRPEEIEQVKGALEQLAYAPTPNIVPVEGPAPDTVKTSKKKASGGE